MRVADNHDGWTVEYLTPEGWKPLSGPYKDREFASGWCEGMQKTLPKTEFRVYEALKPKDNK